MKTEHENKRCTATHPDKPDFSGNARGRKLHLSKNEERTFCNMLIDEEVKGQRLEHFLFNGKCKVCFTGERKEKFKDTFTIYQYGKAVKVTC